ncbi:NAD-dependent epimerase/dehydratase family protein [Microbulbifer halophilus]|uniref:NAD-dependent epimerase/dehydratase family protein n=1 Tax=Microbulbifer halophilus TaxID=453963 RepID=A0ABW5EI04_9GAMM|nr:NAD-dependent epimerase/dehydratase family protein [Microbulbifer halophilus]MCW8127738.1 NAD-dependent epimerase/dehydratase family protein [Microbulbifer halophilus]
MHAFITGGTGFLGANLIEQLIADGWRVTAMHRPGSAVARLRELGAEPVEASLGDIESLRRVLPEKVEAVFHVAGNTSMWRGGDARQWRDNVEGSANIARVARERKAGRLIVTSSISAYGYRHASIDESSPQLADDPRYGYLYTKKRAELSVRAEIERGLDAVFLNPCAIVGKYDTASWAQTFFLIDKNRLPGVPPGRGSFCHAGAVARAHIDAWHRGRCGENYILAGIDASFLDFFGRIAAMLGKPVPQRTTPAFVIHTVGWLSDLWSRFSGREPKITPQKAALISRRVVASSAKAERELGYRSDVDLDTMLRECRDWLVEQGLLTIDRKEVNT